jgi:hypothetical protein
MVTDGRTYKTIRRTDRANHGAIFHRTKGKKRSNRVDLHIVLADTRWPLHRPNAGHSHGLVTSRFSILRPIAVDL